MYLDGQQEAQFTHTGYTLNATAFRVGAGQISATDTGTNNFITGDIADFRITKGVVRYTGTFTPPQAALPQGPAVAASTNVPTTGVLSLAEDYQTKI